MNMSAFPRLDALFHLLQMLHVFHLAVLAMPAVVSRLADLVLAAQLINIPTKDSDELFYSVPLSLIFWLVLSFP
jgi:hypothetical protein